MKIKTLFETYEILITNKLGIESLFTSSGMVNAHKILDFGFFPLGSGILSEKKSQIEKASIEEEGVMILGNDFGTVTYLQSNCKNEREDNSKTITNLLQLGLSLENTFFSNLYLGVRNDLLHEGTTMTKRVKKLNEDYKQLCYNIFNVQLEMINPKTIICLGTEVGQALSEHSNLFKTFSRKYSTITNLYADDSKADYIIRVDDNFLGERKFILIPHPSYGHINWVKNDIKNKIIKAIND